MQFSNACGAREKDWGGTAPGSSLAQEIKNAAAILQRQARTVSHELKSAATLRWHRTPTQERPTSRACTLANGEKLQEPDCEMRSKTRIVNCPERSEGTKRRCVLRSSAIVFEPGAVGIFSTNVYLSGES